MNTKIIATFSKDLKMTKSFEMYADEDSALAVEQAKKILDIGLALEVNWEKKTITPLNIE